MTSFFKLYAGPDSITRRGRSIEHHLSLGMGRQDERGRK